MTLRESSCWQFHLISPKIQYKGNSYLQKPAAKDFRSTQAIYLTLDVLLMGTRPRAPWQAVEQPCGYRRLSVAWLPHCWLGVPLSA